MASVGEFVRFAEVVKEAPAWIKEFLDQSCEVIDSARKFAEKVVSAVDDAVEKINYLQAAEVKYTSEVGKCCLDLSAAYDRADKFVVTAIDVCWFGCDETEVSRVKEELTYGNFGPLNDFIANLQRGLLKTEEFYIEFEESCNEASQRSTTAAEACKCKAVEARSKKRATQVIGGVASGGLMAAGIGGGVAASIAVGFFTFGVGTVVGLTATGVGSAIAGVGLGTGAAVTTHFISADFSEREKGFRKLAETFDILANSALGLHTSAVELRTKLELLASYLDNVEDAKNAIEVIRCVSRALDVLYRRFDDTYSMLSRKQENLHRSKEELEHKIASLHNSN